MVDVEAIECVTVPNVTLVGSLIFAFFGADLGGSASRFASTLTLTLSGCLATWSGCRSGNHIFYHEDLNPAHFSDDLKKS